MNFLTATTRVKTNPLIVPLILIDTELFLPSFSLYTYIYVYTPNQAHNVREGLVCVNKNVVKLAKWHPNQSVAPSPGHDRQNAS